MKRLTMTMLALATACLLIGTVTSAAAGPTAKAATTKVKTKVKLFYSAGTPPYAESAFSGKVKGRKGCKKARKVKITKIGATKSDKKGNFAIAARGSVPPGTYVAKVKKKKVKKGSRKIVCKKAKSKPIVVP